MILRIYIYLFQSPAQVVWGQTQVDRHPLPGGLQGARGPAPGVQARPQPPPPRGGQGPALRRLPPSNSSEEVCPRYGSSSVACIRRAALLLSLRCPQGRAPGVSSLRRHRVRVPGLSHVPLPEPSQPPGVQPSRGVHPRPWS